MGGNGSDTVDYSSSTTGLTVALDATSNTTVNAGTHGTDTLGGIENIKTGIGNDSVTATGTVANVIDVGAGNDKVVAGDGDDTVFGGVGDDSLDGGVGTDSLVGGDGNDTLIGGAGADTLDARTGNTSLVNDSINAGADNDTVIISQDTLGSATVNLDGGTGSDMLQVYKGTATAALDLTSLKATNFETLDVLTDTTGGISVTLSSAGVQQLVGASASSVLTLRLGSNDSYTVAVESGVSVSQGQSIKFYSNPDLAASHLIAQVNFSYV
ncbi:hypothetical protein B9Z33_09380 [Limnohabitans sp. T6-20]|nr:hypothetical protein B9Z33_09380 [Limnohabitans sp. T6-20]